MEIATYSLVRMIRGKIRNKVVNQFPPENARKKANDDLIAFESHLIFSEHGKIVYRKVY